MKSAIVQSKGLDSVAIQEVPLPSAPGPHEVIVRISVVSLVWRDLAEAKHASKPYVPGNTPVIPSFLSPLPQEAMPVAM